MKKITLRLSAILMFLVFGTFLSAQTTFNVTFNVDMTNAEEFNAETDDVYISGTMAGWAQPGSDENYKMMPTEENPMIYTITTTADSGMVQYKFFRVVDNTPTWELGEWGGDPNRITLLLMNNLVFNNVWANKPHFVTFNVDVTPALDSAVFNPESDQIFITGDFAGWMMPGTIPELAFTAGDDNIYSLTTLMYNGDYQYKYFVVQEEMPSWDNGEWPGDPNRTLTVDTTVTEVNDIWALLSGVSNILQPTYTVFPNPVQNTLFIRNLEKADRIEIYNMVGQKVKSIENISTHDVNIDAAELNNGVYFISVYTAKGVQTTKFIKK
jgi:hypothetical protein